ncbi:MAG: F0F1 ATP synthase subunit delta [Rhodospirillales bacterium]|nr:F0F1 ATP synthase subunit delta [Rhodospirillales bacterium]
MPSQARKSGGLAKRYAIALFELAEEAKALDRVEADLEQLTAMLGESADLRRLIRSPVIGRDDQGRAMAALTASVGMHDLTRRFAGLLARNGRLFALPEVIGAYREILAGRRGKSAAEVISAKALTEAQKSAIANALQKATGGDVAISASVDPELLGGLIVRIGSRMVDSSLRTKLQRLRLAMKGVG